MQSQFIPRFDPSNSEYQVFFTLLDELRTKKTKLEAEVALIEKNKKPDGLVVQPITNTEQKYIVFTQLLNDIEEEIKIFNEQYPENNMSKKTDKTEEFWLMTSIYSCVLHTMIEKMHILIAYRSLAKPAVGIVPSLCLAGAAIFALPATPFVAAVTAFFGGLQLTKTVGFSSVGNYKAFSDSFSLVARLSDELMKVLSQMEPHVFLPEDYDIEADYKILGLENRSPLEKIHERIYELQGLFKTELSRVNKMEGPVDNLRKEIADKMVESMKAALVTTAFVIKNDQAYRPPTPQ